MSTNAAFLASTWLVLRSLLWTILLPGFVAGYVPWRFFGLDQARPEWSDPVHLLALLLIAAGAFLLAACIVEFARSGRGTLSPADPPRELVVQGLYRYVRNPMYLSVSTIVLGEVLLLQSWALAIYWGLWLLGVNLFVIGYEEPYLRRRFGTSYQEYTRRVNRWCFRLAKLKKPKRKKAVIRAPSVLYASGNTPPCSCSSNHCLRHRPPP